MNNVVCHGIPDDRPLADGDIISVDITVSNSVAYNYLFNCYCYVTCIRLSSFKKVYANGVHGDCCRTFCVGNVDDEGQYLTRIAEFCRDEAIKVCAPGVPFRAIGATIEQIANEYKLNIVEEFVGHGIGKSFHEPPQVIHYGNNLIK